MKIILIKEFKNNKINDIVEVKPGFAINFLIKNGYAVPINKLTKFHLDKNIQNLKYQEASKFKDATFLKKQIENLELNFELKKNNDNVHGSITRKKILDALLNNNIKINITMIENIRINKIGLTNIKINLYKNVFALLKIQVMNAKEKL